ncbi:hypothetical protein KOW79_005286 [Hemibagrus wyckioides]|uniref:Uncharacterized protein n=1 Tax=Hemibagrus wyckioides TaxID=337641 RepID=A0A9D3NZ94_9TELE|nr:hypothetical protein KOW79_005286 [Hemibagrus wyckioides]
MFQSNYSFKNLEPVTITHNPVSLLPISTESWNFGLCKAACPEHHQISTLHLNSYIDMSISVFLEILRKYPITSGNKDKIHITMGLNTLFPPPLHTYFPDVHLHPKENLK